MSPDYSVALLERKGALQNPWRVCLANGPLGTEGLYYCNSLCFPTMEAAQEYAAGRGYRSEVDFWLPDS